jgi:hypothetical protein
VEGSWKASWISCAGASRSRCVRPGLERSRPSKLIDPLVVERSGGLVSEQQVRLHEQRSGDHHPRQQTARQLVRVLLESSSTVADAHLVEHGSCGERSRVAPHSCSVQGLARSQGLRGYR